MHTEKVWIVIVLLVVILGVSNLAMFALVRGWSPRKGEKGLGQQVQDFTKPWKAQDEQLKELSQRVKELKSDEDEQ
jgi:hypothetical protein